MAAAASGAAAAVAATTDFHAGLIGPTLANAVRAPFYRDLWGAADPAAIGLDGLATLPLVDKPALRAAGEAARLRDGLVCTEVFTSGTTGEPFVSLRGDREQRYVAEFFAAVGTLPDGAPRPRALQFNNPYHGSLTAIPSPFHLHGVGIYDRGAFGHARRVLAGEHRDRGVEPWCTVMIGLERILRAFTHDGERLAAAGEPPASRLACIISFSQYLTAEWRQRHQRLWNCPVIDRFSLSEVFGGATQSQDCGWWHFDPVIVPEVVGHRSRRPLREGLGLLVLTALYPFQEAQPMVRYLTGDLVEVTHSRSSRPGQLAIRPLGRAHAGVPLPEGDGWLLSPAAVYEAVDRLETVARLPRFLDAADVRDPHAIGHPRYRLDWRAAGSKVVVTLRLELQPGIAPAARRRTTEHLAAELCDAAPALGEAGCLEIRLDEVLQPQLIAHAD